MANSNEDIIKNFFEAYEKHDMKAIKRVMSEDVKWYFLGRHPLAGIKNGVEEVVAFFDTMAGIMKKSKPQIDKLITASNENHFIECQHIQTNREDGNNISHHVSVLWTIEGGKIISGRHFFADPEAVDSYFTRVVEEEHIHH
jgi:ketosteroid isomerase-like protein